MASAVPPLFVHPSTPATSTSDQSDRPTLRYRPKGSCRGLKRCLRSPKRARNAPRTELETCWRNGRPSQQMRSPRCCRPRTTSLASISRWPQNRGRSSRVNQREVQNLLLEQRTLFDMPEAGFQETRDGTDRVRERGWVGQRIGEDGRFHCYWSVLGVVNTEIGHPHVPWSDLPSLDARTCTSHSGLG